MSASTHTSTSAVPDVCAVATLESLHSKALRSGMGVEARACPSEWMYMFCSGGYTQDIQLLGIILASRDTRCSDMGHWGATDVRD
jgi:hypothetical protein